MQLSSVAAMMFSELCQQNGFLWHLSNLNRSPLLFFLSSHYFLIFLAEDWKNTFHPFLIQQISHFLCRLIISFVGSFSRIKNVSVISDKDVGFLFHSDVICGFSPENKPRLRLHMDFRIKSMTCVFALNKVVWIYKYSKLPTVFSVKARTFRNGKCKTFITSAK